MAPNRKVTFSYESRQDPTTARLAGFALTVIRRLKEVLMEAPSPQSPATPVPGAEARPQEQADREALRGLGYTEGGAADGGRRAEAYPGTGWGESRHDPVVTVQFEPERWAAETLTLRYEYRPALVRLGLLPPCCRPEPDRLAERESGRDGFARPPRW